MIDTSVLVDNFVVVLRDIPELVEEMGGDPERIYAYHDQYPKKVSLAHATLGARLARARPLAGEASGTSTVLGRASCVRSLAGVAAGWSRVSGFLLPLGGTPASRTLRVRMDARTLRPTREDRRHTVRREARVLVPAAEDRTIHPRIEDRSIDA